MLEKYAKRTVRKGVTKTMTARIDASVYEDFKRYCEGLGLTISEGVNLLIEEELHYVVTGEYGREYTMKARSNTTVDTWHTASLDMYDSLNTDEYKGPTATIDYNTPVSQENTDVSQDEYTLNTSVDRFTTKQYEKKGKLFCPLCGEWKSAGNFDRHAQQQHNTTRKAIYTNTAYLQVIQSKLN